jgi:hypothetical protein
MIKIKAARRNSSDLNSTVFLEISPYSAVEVHLYHSTLPHSQVDNIVTDLLKASSYGARKPVAK